MPFDAEALPPTTQNLLRLRAIIASNPAEMFDYQESLPDEWLSVDPSLDCGTPMCILGWARAMLGTIDTHAVSEALGLSDFQAKILFLNGFVIRPQPTAPQALAVLDHLIATGEVDWSVVK